MIRRISFENVSCAELSGPAAYGRDTRHAEQQSLMLIRRKAFSKARSSRTRLPSKSVSLPGHKPVARQEGDGNVETGCDCCLPSCRGVAERIDPHFPILRNTNLFSGFRASLELSCAAFGSGGVRRIDCLEKW